MAVQRRGPIDWIDGVRLPVPFLVRLAVGIPIVYLAIMKLLDPIEFVKLTHQYGILPTEPPHFINVVAVVLPYLELMCGVGLILGLLRRGAALLVVGMMVFFLPMLVVHAVQLLHAQPDKFASFCEVCFDCGCGTGVVCICSKTVENALLLLGGLYLLVSRSDAWSLTALIHGRR